MVTQAEFVGTMEADSLDVVEWVMALEEELAIEIPDDMDRLIRVWIYRKAFKP